MSLSATGIDGKGNLCRGVRSATSPALLQSSGLAPCTPQRCPPSSSSSSCPVLTLLRPLCHFQFLGGMKVLLLHHRHVEHELCQASASGWGLPQGVGWAVCRAGSNMDQCVSPHTRGADPLWMEVGAFGRPQINDFRAGTGFLTSAKSVCVCDVSRCASSSSSASHPLSCLPWCPPETPSTDRVWEVPVPGNWQAGPGSAGAGAASLHCSSTCFPSLDGPCHSNTNAAAGFPVTLTQLSCTGRSPLCPPACARGVGEGPSFVPSQAFHQLDLCIPVQPHPALVSWQDAEVAHRRQNPGGAPGCAPLPPQRFANCFSMEKSIVLGGAWDDPTAEFHPRDVMDAHPA